MARDDWKHYDEMGDEGEEEASAPAPKEKLCANCLHTVAFEAPYCPWCGKPFTEPKRPPGRNE